MTNQNEQRHITFKQASSKNYKIYLAVLPVLFMLDHVVVQKTDKFMGETVKYDEAAVPAYTLPDVLKTVEGQHVKNTAAREKIRKPEILALFE